MNNTYPERVGIIYTDTCNFDCTFCATHLDYEKNTISLEQFKKIIDKLVEHGIKEVELTPVVGEVTLHPKFMDMVDYAVDNDVTIEIHTNLSRWHRWRKLFAKRAIYSGRVNLTVSVYGLEESSYYYTTKHDGFDKFIMNLRNLLSVDLKYLNNVTITKRIKSTWYTDMDEMLHKFARVKLIKLEHSYEHGNWGGHLPHLNDLDKDIPEDRLSARSNCPALDYFTGIWPDGDVSYCGAHDIHKKETVGNIFEDFDEVYDLDFGAIGLMKRSQMKGMWSGLCEKCNWFYR